MALLSSAAHVNVEGASNQWSLSALSVPQEVHVAQTERDRWQVFVQSQSGNGPGAVTEIYSTYAAEFERDMPLPITTLEEDEIILEWNTDDLYLEIEVRGGRVDGWFFRDTQNNLSDSGSGVSGQLLSQIARFDAAA